MFLVEGQTPKRSHISSTNSKFQPVSNLNDRTVSTRSRSPNSVFLADSQDLRPWKAFIAPYRRQTIVIKGLGAQRKERSRRMTCQVGRAHLLVKRMHDIALSTTYNHGSFTHDTRYKQSLRALQSHHQLQVLQKYFLIGTTNQREELLELYRSNRRHHDK